MNEQTPAIYSAPCGWRCQGGDLPTEPAVAAAIETLRAAGYQAMIVWRRPLSDEWGADMSEPALPDAEVTREHVQRFASQTGAFLCHLSRVRPIPEKS
jgi:hypothetical protein